MVIFKIPLKALQKSMLLFFGLATLPFFGGAFSSCALPDWVQLNGEPGTENPYSATAQSISVQLTVL